MKSELSSLDLYYLIYEFQILLGAKIDKVFSQKSDFLFQIHIPSIGKKYLRVQMPSLIYLTTHKPEYDDSTKFGISIRKHIKNTRIRKIKQVGFERIIELSLESIDKTLYLYIELFKPGNIILTDSNKKIIMASTYKAYGSRLIRPANTYSYPIKDFNFLKIDESNLKEIINNSDKSSIVITLATELGLGGIYAEALCESSNIDKNSKKITNDELIRLFSEIEKLKEVKISLNEKLDQEFTKKTKNDIKIKQTSKLEEKKSQLNGIIRQQLSMIKGLEKSAEQNQEKGEMIYEKYIEITNILKQLKIAKEKMSTQEIKNKLKGHLLITDIKEKEIILDFK